MTVCFIISYHMAKLQNNTTNNTIIHRFLHESAFNLSLIIPTGIWRTFSHYIFIHAWHSYKYREKTPIMCARVLGCLVKSSVEWMCRSLLLYGNPSVKESVQVHFSCRFCSRHGISIRRLQYTIFKWKKQQQHKQLREKDTGHGIIVWSRIEQVSLSYTSSVEVTIKTFKLVWNIFIFRKKKNFFIEKLHCYWS